MTPTFNDRLRRYPHEWIEEQMSQVSSQDIQSAIGKAAHFQHLTPEMLVALLSPQAIPHLEEMATVSKHLTQQRFGKIVQLFVPLYLSNECLCTCTYCGFSHSNQIARKTLRTDEIIKEAHYLHQQGFRHILLVSGEDTRYVNVESLKEVATLIRHQFSSIAIEIQPLKQEQYLELVKAGIDGVTVYQETYDRACYRKVHLAGRKKNYDYRLETPERAGLAGIRKIGIGALLGLSNWRYDCFYTGLHAQFLEKKCWQSHISVSCLRINEATGNDQPVQGVSKANLVQAMIALRLFLPNVGITLSTRESSQFRNHVFPLCVTQMSAGSRTTIGGYVEENESGAQFEVTDESSPEQVTRMIQNQGYEPVWKDWDAAFLERVAV